MKTLPIKNLLPAHLLADKLSHRWMPNLKSIPTHKLALAAAGLAVTATTVANPALAVGEDTHATVAAPAAVWPATSGSGSAGGSAGGHVVPAQPSVIASNNQPAAPDTGGPAALKKGPAKKSSKDKGAKKGAKEKGATEANRPKQDPLAVAKAEEAGMPRDKVLSVDYQPQSTFFYCGPAATRIVASAGGHDLSQDEAAAKLGTTDSGTPSAVDTTRVLNDVFGGNTYHTTSVPDRTPTQRQADQVQSDVMHTLNAGRAVVANIAGTTTDVTGATHTFNGGHYVAVVGYHDQGGTVLISDPADVNGADSYWISTNNLTQWMATRGYSS